MNLLRINNLDLRSIFVLFGLAGFLMTDCAPKPKLLPEDRTPQNVLRCALGNRVEFDTFACLMKLKLKGEDAKFAGTIEFFYKHAGTFSFHPRTLFGMGMFKAGGTGDSLTIYFPKQNEFYAGSFSDFEKTSLWDWEIPLEILLELILGKGGWSDQPPRYAGRRVDLFSYASEDDAWKKTFLVDSRTCRLIQSWWSAKTGGEYLQIEYKNFKTRYQVDTPYMITIRSRTGDYAQIKFLERKFNSSIPPERFELQIPPDARRVVFESGEE